MLKKRNIAAVLAVLSGLVFIGSLIEPFMLATFKLQLPGFIPDWLHTRIEEYALEQTGFAVGPQFLLEVIGNLYDSTPVLGVIVFAFSIVIPVLKILICLLVAINLLPRDIGPRAVLIISKWSMADVFIVAFLVVLFKAEDLVYYFETKLGFWFFLTSVILSSTSAYFLTTKLENK